MSNNFFSKVLDIFGMGDGEESEENETVDDAVVEDKQPIEVISGGKRNKVVNIHSTSNAKVIIMQPLQYDEITSLCDCLKNRKIVIMNLQKLDQKLAQRFVDFAGGATYALDGEIQEVSPGILLLAPSNVDVSSDLKDELTSRGLFSWNR